MTEAIQFITRQNFWIISMRSLVVMMILIFSTPAFSQDIPKFQFPVECELEKDCWAVNYVDVALEDNVVQDFRCGQKTYDAHKGSDFAVRSLAEVNKGVYVLAGKDGEILRVRDGESDTPKTEEQLESIKTAKKECGNAVLINHGQGLTSIYCHLKKNSISVKAGDQVKAGQRIGKIGHSGMAEFPHVHFGVTWEGAIMDPFTGMNAEAGCGRVRESMWQDSRIQYSPFALYDGGFRAGIPDFNAIQGGEENPKTLSSESDALVFWHAIYGPEKGDQIRLEILDPEGQLFADRNIIQDKTRARQYYYTGRSMKERDLKTGQYTGRVIMTRDSQEKIFETKVEIKAAD